MVRLFTFLALATFSAWLSPTLPAQDAKPAAEAAKPAPQKADAEKGREQGPFRKLAPYVLTKIPQETEVNETFSQHDAVELLAADPKYDWAKEITYRHQIWQLEFEFKPMRMIYVDIPQSGGKMQRKLIWYMIYTVKNTGKVLVPVQDQALPYEKELTDKQKAYVIKEETQPIRFFPEFLIEGSNRMKEGDGFAKIYPDRVIPIAVGPIQMREDPKRKLLNTVEMCREVAVGETLWGVATWEDIDPRIVRFSVYVTGLTNAYRWKDAPGSYKAGDPIGKGRQLIKKTLKLNFWRPGDEYFEHEEAIRYGIPGQPDYQWTGGPGLKWQ
ncbi:MAG: hypothetical protein IT426_10435 [Pirellulales bacterium]|nr:hypothetical protein [Pirellulales bacterium]